MDRLVTIRSSRYGLDIELDPDADMRVLLEKLDEKFRETSRFFENAKMALSFSGRRLSRPEEDRILGIIQKNTQIDVVCIVEQEDGGTAYRSIVEQAAAGAFKEEGMFYRGTLERRQILESDSDLVILGDVEPGAKVSAGGNIVIMGSLYGSAHAGSGGDKSAFIAALFLQPKELWIGDVEANRHIICQESLSIKGPKIAVVDGNRIYLDPLVD
ncbi:MAG TPA: septum formation inhibitor [Candidatus Mediterraneibacter pullistercoris]|nr:septum formation inhibitor [Candidatus Mediterraneibacter pullistercoris]